MLEYRRMVDVTEHCLSSFYPRLRTPAKSDSDNPGLFFIMAALVLQHFTALYTIVQQMFSTATSYPP